MAKEKKFTSVEIKCCASGFMVVAPERHELGAYRFNEDVFCFETFEGVEEWLKENLDYTEYA
jgi:hypothetical protein